MDIIYFIAAVLRIVCYIAIGAVLGLLFSLLAPANEAFHWVFDPIGLRNLPMWLFGAILGLVVFMLSCLNHGKAK